MKNVQSSTTPINHQPAFNNALQKAHVVAVDEQIYTVKTSYDQLEAIKAASCLLTPQKGDQVLIAQLEYEQAIIIAIITQAQPAQQNYQLSPNVHLVTGNGQLALVAKQFDCFASHDTNFYTQNLSMTAERSAASFNQHHLQSQLVTENIGHLESDVSTIEQVVTSYNFTAQYAFEKVTDIQHQIIGQCHMHVNKNYRFDCDTADFYAEGDIKMEGKQIHMG